MRDPSARLPAAARHVQGRSPHSSTTVNVRPRNDATPNAVRSERGGSLC